MFVDEDDEYAEPEDDISDDHQFVLNEAKSSKKF